jgi:hypothetical protein
MANSECLTFDVSRITLTKIKRYKIVSLKPELIINAE